PPRAAATGAAPAEGPPPRTPAPAPARAPPTPPAPPAAPPPPPPTRLDAPPAVRAPLTDQEVADQMVAHLLWARLVGVDDRGEPYPDLAERVPTIENGGARWVGDGDARQLEVTLRPRGHARGRAGPR